MLAAPGKEVGTRTLCFLKFLICYALIPHHKANYAHCFTSIMLSLYSIVQVSTHHKSVSLLFMIDLATHFYAQDRQVTITLDLIAH